MPSAPPADAGGAACYGPARSRHDRLYQPAFGADASGGEVLLVDTDGGAISHAKMP